MLRRDQADRAEIKTLGFQSGQGLRFDENIKHAFFIYPDENVGALISPPLPFVQLF